MINDDTYKNYMKDILKELNSDKNNNMNILLEKRFIKDKEEEVKEVEETEEFRRSIPKTPIQPKSIDSYERRRVQLTKNINNTTREKINQANRQKYLDAINNK